MNQSLKKSIALFELKDQLKIYITLVAFKLKIRLPEFLSLLFNNLMVYVRIYESGVLLKITEGHLIEATLKINNRWVTVFLRRNSSDLQVFESVLLNNEYNPAVQQLLKTDNHDYKQIIDAGGNIGLTSIYFLCFFPDAYVTIIEPDEYNFSLLKKNIQQNGFKNTLLLKNALWINNDPLVIDDSFRDGKEWSLTVQSKATNNATDRNTELIGITLKDICFNRNEVQINLLKIDIEGAERLLFLNDEFLNTIDKYVENLVIEIHDEFKIRDTINNEMLGMNFVKSDYGDITCYQREKN
jgi:FkbM family methyltransferase